MNVAVKHNGTTITDRVISYKREHKICTGIGVLEIILEGTYSAAIAPHDQIDIYENGSFQVRYYVSDVAHSVPDGTIVLQCQDKSKYLVDYFIPNSYTIDYPSYTRYWIEKFLAEAGITYHFTTSSQGNLISNYTSLGLQPAYDQIMMLLQLSGWYMYFDGNGRAIIGTLDTDLAQSAGSINKTDILDMSVVENDKMLRNRALVWGSYDPFSHEYAFADVTKHTRWNYDRNDVRTVVISNQNIPNNSSAHNIANKLIKEFAKITVEKNITIYDARNYDLGKTLKVSSSIWRGKGLITTFGVNMDRNGLVTVVTLDERCPRLFGYFNFGDWVYVGTFGDGVWRKHIRFDSTWYNFSSGLTNLNITDLHINNGVFGAVSHSGEMFRAESEDGPWIAIPTPPSLDSSREATVASGDPVVWQAFSGVMARAVILDKETNIIKYGLDTWSGMNTGDYFMTYSGFLATSSGVTASGITTSGIRAWIAEYDPFTGQLFTSETQSGVYPISYSGNYDMQVLDLENDGKNDYVSVKTNGSLLIPHTISGYDFGYHTSQLPSTTQDLNNRISFAPLTQFSDINYNYAGTLGSVSCLTVFDNESIGERELVYAQTGTLKRLTMTGQAGSLSTTTLTSPSFTMTGNSRGIVKIATDYYRICSFNKVGFTYSIYYRDWNVSTNSISAETLAGLVIVPDDPYHSSTEFLFEAQTIIHDNKLYQLIEHEVRNESPISSDPDFDLKANNYAEIYTIVFDISTLAFSGGLRHKFIFNTGVPLGAFWHIQNMLGGTIYTFQNGENSNAAIFINENDSATTWTNYLISSNDFINFNITTVQSTNNSSDPDFVFNVNSFAGNQLTGEHYMVWMKKTSNNAALVYNGSTITPTHLVSIPFQYVTANIYGLFGNFDSYYIAKNGSDWWFCDPQTFDLKSQLVLPTGYTATKPFVTTDTVSPYYYWQATNPAHGSVILKTSESSLIEDSGPIFYTSTAAKAFICGNFFIDYAGGLSTVAPANYLYLYNVSNVPDRGTGYLVLQRENSDFNLIQQADKPIRIDISNNSPILTTRDVENTFQSNFVFENELIQVIPISGLDQSRQVRDYRYTSLETTSSGTIVASGVGVQEQALYVTQSGVYNADLNSYSGGFILLDSIPSGLLERIEITNYVYPGQFIFVTTSGENPMFYQRDNDGLTFTPYSGLPISRATIIRCDDRL